MRRRNLIAFLLSSVIALQSLAAIALPCAAPVDSGDSSTQAADMARHAGHDMGAGAAQAADTPAMDCCDGGYCSQSGCVGMMFSLSVAASDCSPQHDPISIRTMVELPDWSPDSPFRPPTA